MKKIKVIFESNDGATGYVIDASKMSMTAGRFNKEFELEEITQEAVISDKTEFSRQMIWVITAALDG